MIVVIPCGARKRSGRAQAQDLYTGPYFRACLAYARTLAPDDAIYILSGKYGLLALTDEIETYEQRMGAPGSISLAALREQVVARGLQDERVIAVAGREYVAVCRRLWQDVATPLDGSRGMGKQLQWMKAQREHV